MFDVGPNFYTVLAVFLGVGVLASNWYGSHLKEKAATERHASDKKLIESLQQENRELLELKTNELKTYHRKLVHQLDRIHSPRLEVYKMVPSLGDMTLYFDNTSDKTVTYVNFQYKARMRVYKDDDEVELIDENKFYYYYHSLHPTPKYINPNDKFELKLGFPNYQELVNNYDYDRIEIDFYLVRLRTKDFQSNDERLSLIITKDGSNLSTAIDGSTSFRLKVR
ncbi:Uncharacterised protein [BD1-7 clade bacterium]|uniref:Uncharacterized protein n=1 Tax=BD1-7 clade bacterium TaxID=2029982 RepID=A0A5S9Q6Q2_9GAMM|nr:Uncharacterised protein [BD1-7 clade bacterium]